MKQWIEIWHTQKKNGKYNYTKVHCSAGKKTVAVIQRERRYGKGRKENL